MQRELEVYIDLARQPVLVGRLWARERAGRETSSFTYDRNWLQSRNAFALAPNMPLSPGQFHSPKSLFNAFTDPAPDSWGRKLMRRHERARAAQDGRAARTLFDIDFLAGVDDFSRLGALRFKVPGSEDFLTGAGQPIPPVIDLAQLLAASDKIERGRESDADVRMMLGPGTSLGGARPKATVRGKGGELLFAKFPKRDDDWPVTRWEATALALAHSAGITVPGWKLHSVARKPVLILERFDRVEIDRRVAFMSALTALDASDHAEQRSYLELVDVLRQQGAAPERDLAQLWRRMAFNILISNTDDHLRNHAFLHETGGWGLSPAYDLNPTPVEVKPRIHALALDEADATASLETALKVASSFGLKQSDALTIAHEVGVAVSKWREIAKSSGLKAADFDFMASAFEHEDLRRALASPEQAAIPAKTKRKPASGKGEGKAAGVSAGSRPKGAKPARKKSVS